MVHLRKFEWDKENKQNTLYLRKGNGRKSSMDKREKEISQNENLKEKAQNKLKSELENAKDKSFAELVIEYLLKRCAEDKGVAEDVLLEHKTWEKCYSYIYEQARKQAHNNRVIARDEVVFEWAEDYFHKDDKAEEKMKRGNKNDDWYG